MSGEEIKYLKQELIDEIKNRVVLHWNFRDFDKLPLEILHFGTHVEELYLKWNCLSSLPDWIDELKQLTNIYLDCNKIVNLPDSFGSLKLLTIIEIQSNSLVKLPNTIGKLENLSILNLQNNKITKLPPEIEDLHSLAFLNLKSNQLTELPEALCKLNSLQELIVDDNLLISLPLSIVYLPNLNYLSLNGNNIAYLPFCEFINKCTICFLNNSELNYIPYKLGFNLSDKIKCSSEETLWQLDIQGCCSGNLDMKKRAEHIIIHVSSKNIELPLPKIVKQVHNDHKFNIATLCELTLRKIYAINFRFGETRECLQSAALNELPSPLYKILWDGPVANCHHCRTPLFTEFLLWLIPRHILSLKGDAPEEIIAAVCFCSPSCTKEFSTLEALNELILDKLSVQTLDWKAVKKK